jgi:hypothetical protein
MEKYLRSQITSYEDTDKHINGLAKTMTLKAEAEIIDKNHTVDGNVHKLMDYCLDSKKSMIDNKSRDNKELNQLISDHEKSLKDDFGQFEQLKNKLNFQKEEFNKDRNLKLSLFNSINQSRRQSNSIQEKNLKELSATNSLVKKLYKQLVLILNLIKSRILNFEELIELEASNKTATILGYFLNPDTFDYKIFKINSDSGPHDKMREYWRGMKEVWGKCKSNQVNASN